MHNEIFRRVTHILSLQDSERWEPYITWVKQFPDVAQAGSFWPDWGYGCLNTDEVSELAHWPPFLKASVEYVREKYPNPKQSLSAQKLLVFLFAVVAHQSADTSWHSLGLLQGFLREVAAYDFGFNYEEAHKVLDPGGDVLMAARMQIEENGYDWISVYKITFHYIYIYYF